MRMFKVGGIRFLRIGRVQFSFCLCRRKLERRPPVRVSHDLRFICW